MSIDELLGILRNRLAYLDAQRDHAVATGDVQLVAVLDADKATTQASVTALESLSGEAVAPV